VIRFCALGSGSGGNAWLVEVRDLWSVTRILVDCGFGPRVLARRLERVAGCALDDIDVIVLTHEHGDHVAGLRRVLRHASPRLLSSAGTWRALDLAPPAAGWQRVVAGTASIVGGAIVTALAVSHDASEPLQFAIDDGQRRLVLLTDLGSFDDALVAGIGRPDALVIECNHDADLLWGGDDPVFLKRRIGGERGHLSNAQAAALLAAIDRGRLNGVVAAHLSARNNQPMLARAALAAVLGVDDGEVDVADQHEGLGWRTV
jgi:phosphoribosyl 1,2-cyclic phosphodiesterase